MSDEARARELEAELQVQKDSRNVWFNEISFARDYACKAAGLDPDEAGWKTAIDALTQRLAEVERERDLQKEVADNQTWWVKKLRATEQERIAHILEQDKRLDALQRENVELDEKLEAMTANRDDWRAHFNAAEQDVAKLRRELAAVRAETTRLREALQYYAKTAISARAVEALAGRKEEEQS